VPGVVVALPPDGDPPTEDAFGAPEEVRPSVPERPSRPLRSRRPAWAVRSDRRQGRSRSRPSSWLLQDAKARFSELVRRVKAEGSVHGREEVVVILERFGNRPEVPHQMSLSAAADPALGPELGHWR